jgi:hypothetical protein
MRDLFLEKIISKDIIINKGENLSMYCGQIMTTEEAWIKVHELIKLGRAKKVLDNEYTLQYHLLDD